MDTDSTPVFNFLHFGKHFSELAIKLIDIDEITNVLTLTGHRRGLKSLSFDPKGEFLVSAGSDGELMVWDLRGDQPKVARALRSLISTSDPE